MDLERNKTASSQAQYSHKGVHCRRATSAQAVNFYRARRRGCRSYLSAPRSICKRAPIESSMSKSAHDSKLSCGAGEDTRNAPRTCAALLVPLALEHAIEAQGISDRPSPRYAPRHRFRCARDDDDDDGDDGRDSGKHERSSTDIGRDYDDVCHTLTSCALEPRDLSDAHLAHTEFVHVGNCFDDDDDDDSGSDNDDNFAPYNSAAGADRYSQREHDAAYAFSCPAVVTRPVRAECAHDHARVSYADKERTWAVGSADSALSRSHASWSKRDIADVHDETDVGEMYAMRVSLADDGYSAVVAIDLGGMPVVVDCDAMQVVRLVRMRIIMPCDVILRSSSNAADGAQGASSGEDCARIDVIHDGPRLTTKSQGILQQAETIFGVYLGSRWGPTANASQDAAPCVQNAGEGRRLGTNGDTQNCSHVVALATQARCADCQRATGGHCLLHAPIDCIPSEDHEDDDGPRLAWAARSTQRTHLAVFVARHCGIVATSRYIRAVAHASHNRTWTRWITKFAPRHVLPRGRGAADSSISGVAPHAAPNHSANDSGSGRMFSIASHSRLPHQCATRAKAASVTERRQSDRETEPLLGKAATRPHVHGLGYARLVHSSPPMATVAGRDIERSDHTKINATLVLSQNNVFVPSHGGDDGARKRRRRWLCCV